MGDTNGPTNLGRFVGRQPVRNLVAMLPYVCEVLTCFFLDFLYATTFGGMFLLYLFTVIMPAGPFVLGL
jgi:hypothetical protein